MYLYSPQRGRAVHILDENNLSHCRVEDNPQLTYGTILSAEFPKDMQYRGFCCRCQKIMEQKKLAISKSQDYHAGNVTKTSI